MQGTPDYMAQAHGRMDADRVKGNRSTTGSRKPVVCQEGWRQKLQVSRIKFDDVAKENYLVALYETGQKGLAAEAAGVTTGTVINHIKGDPDFEEAVQGVLAMRSQTIIERLESEALEGHDEDVFNKDGDHIGTRKKYETQLRLAMLKRHDPAYKDNYGINIHNTGEGNVGVLVAPATMTVEQFTEAMAKQRDKQRQLDAQAQQYLEDGKVPTGPVIEGEAVDISDG
jgi:hypothetical protein